MQGDWSAAQTKAENTVKNTVFVVYASFFPCTEKT